MARRSFCSRLLRNGGCAEVIQLDDVAFGYTQASAIVDGVTHEFSGGTLTAVTGPSGSGKSTLLYLIGLMLTPTRGTVLIDGACASRMRDAERSELRARRMGFVFQDALLDPSRSILDNVCEGRLFHPNRRRGLRDRAVELLKRYGVEVDPQRRPGQISGGQAQRVALCRALIADPDIVLADEPTGNLDHASADTVWTALADLAATGATVIVATHDLERAAACDHELQVGHATAG